MRILVADEDVERRIQLVKTLQDLGKHQVLESLAEADLLSKCKTKFPDLLIVHQALVSGQVLRQIRQLGANAVWNPIILIKEQVTEQDRFDAEMAEVDDILSLPISPACLKLKLSSAQRHFDLKREVFNVAHNLVVANRALESVVKIDALSGLANVTYFEDAMHKAWLTAKHNKTGLGLLYIKPDYFSQFNQAYGVTAGDECLINIAYHLKKIAKPKAMLARIDGVVFAYLLECQSAQSIKTEAENLLRALTDLKISHKASNDSKLLSFSIGSAYMDKPVMQTRDLINAVDFALYNAKHTGRGKIYYVSANEIEEIEGL